MTYREDKPAVAEKIRNLIAAGLPRSTFQLKSGVISSFGRGVLRLSHRCLDLGHYDILVR